MKTNPIEKMRKHINGMFDNETKIYSKFELLEAITKYINQKFKRDNLKCYNGVMKMLNGVLGGHGVEKLALHYNEEPIAKYVNLGDAYSQTIILELSTLRFINWCWGDYYEKMGGLE